MRSQQIRVECIFQEQGATIHAILTESFRLYIRRILARGGRSCI